MPASATERGRVRLLAILPFVGLVVVATVLVLVVDPVSVVRSLLDVRLDALAVALALVVALPFVAGAKLWVLLHGAGLGVSYGRSISAVLAGLSLNAVVPGRGGDLAKAALLVEGDRGLARLVGVVLVERLLDVLVLGALASVASLAASARPGLLLGLGACAAALGAFGVLSLGPRAPILQTQAARLSEAVRVLAGRPLRFASGGGFALLGWLGNIAIMGCCFWAVGARLAPWALVSSTPIAILAGTVPITVSGIGTRDGAMVLLLGSQVDQADIVAATLLYTVLLFGVLPLVGLLALGRETLQRVRARQVQP